MNIVDIFSKENREAGRIAELIMELVSTVPPPRATPAINPHAQSLTIADVAAKKAMAVSAGASLPPGPLGFLTILPEIYAVWDIQKRMVADIAASYDKSSAMSRETIVYCLFNHAAGQVVKELAVRLGSRILLRRVTRRILQGILRRVGMKVGQRIIGKAVSRWLPVIGAVGMGAYAWFDTKAVAKTAMELFSGDVEADPVFNSED